jgi:hypothetical protein
MALKDIQMQQKTTIFLISVVEPYNFYGKPTFKKEKKLLLGLGLSSYFL